MPSGEERERERQRERDHVRGERREGERGERERGRESVIMIECSSEKVSLIFLKLCA